MRVVVLLLLLAQVAAAQTVHVGDDPAGDSSNQIVPGGDVGAVITNDRTDILSVSMSQSDAGIDVSLRLTTLPAGTSGYMYRVVWDVGEARYYTCYAVQWTGGTAEATQENVLGCSRFASNTQVGPATTADGIVLDGTTITWPVARSDMGGAGLADISLVHADSWFRGLSDCCVGATSQTQYMWNQADRGPDTDRWLLALADTAAPEPLLDVQVNATRATAPPGGWAAFNLTVVLANVSAPGNVSFALNADWERDGFDAAPYAGNATIERQLRVQVPADLPNGTHLVEVNVTAGNVTRLVELVLDVDAEAPSQPPAATAPPSDLPEPDASEDEPVEESPLPVVLPLLALVFVAVRRY